MRITIPLWFKKLIRLCTILVASTLIISGCSAPVNDSIEVTNPSIRAAFAQATTGAAYVTISNNTSQDDMLLSVSSLTILANDIQLHSMLMQDDMMVMQELPEGIALPKGETVALTPGGLHIMFVGLQTTLDEGKFIALTLTFKHAPAQTINFPIVAMHTTDMPH